MKNHIPIMLVEDDNIDAMITQRALNELKVINKLVHKVNGEDALEYLKDKTNKKPCIILLDLNMPKMNGMEFLKIVKADKALKRIPVVVLTTSTGDQDVFQGFDLGIAGYFIKPVNFMQFVEAIRTLNRYWTLSSLPGESVEP